MKREHTILIIVVVLAAAGAWLTLSHGNSTIKSSAATESTTAVTSAKKTPGQSTSTFDKTQYSLTDPTSIWVVVNKQRPLNPKNYIPPDLVVPNVPLRVPGNESMQTRKVTATAIETMFAAAKKQGINLMLSSGYRSYAYQVSLYGSYQKSQGQSAADTFSARPGYSEHQTGLAVDVEPVSEKCDVDQCFGNLAEGKWVAANAYKYGFIIRYPLNKDKITGYEYEPWHVRYVGVPLATEMHKEGVSTLEEFFGLPAAPDY